MIKRRKKTLRHETTIAVDETSIMSVILNTNAEFIINFISGSVITFRDNGLTGDLWVNSIKTSMHDRVNPNMLEKKNSNKKLKPSKKKN